MAADDHNSRVIAEFRAHEGKVDRLFAGGPFEGARLLLLHTTGTRTGKPYVNPVMYLPKPSRYIVFATKAGAETHPDWYRNLKAHPRTHIEVGARSVCVYAAELHGDERDSLYERQAELYPVFTNFQARTTRRIPVIALIPDTEK